VAAIFSPEEQKVCPYFPRIDKHKCTPYPLSFAKSVQMLEPKGVLKNKEKEQFVSD
jgi:hypothetical protein